VETDTGAWTFHANPALSASGGAGVLAARFIARLGAQVVVSGTYGPKAHRTLSASSIECLVAPGKDACSAAEIPDAVTLGDPTDDATHSGHHGDGTGMRIVVASGKGGTGRTSVVGAFAHLASADPFVGSLLSGIQMGVV
jgi:predicted Fe-Mo cluster-binding NifX family protein